MIGISVYYGVPLSFLNLNFIVAFIILGVLLILVILGMTFLCSLLYSYLERALLWITLQTCCRKDRRIHSVILKQMDSHQIRNNKTSIIFTLAVSFLIFAASYFSLLITIIDKAFGKVIGADIYAFGYNGMITETPVAAYLDEMIKAEGKPVVNYAFKSWDLKSIRGLAESCTAIANNMLLQDLNQYELLTVRLFGIPENYFDVVDADYY